MVIVKMKKIYMLSYALLTATIISCRPDPPLYLCDHERFMIVDLVQSVPPVDSLWSYEGRVDWKKEWKYGWDSEDEKLFGSFYYNFQDDYNIRRFRKDNAKSEHWKEKEVFVKEPQYVDVFSVGLYDMYAWSEPESSNGLSALGVRELDNKADPIAYTNPVQDGEVLHYQPEDILLGSYENMNVPANWSEYQINYEDGKRYRRERLILQPATFIYLVQIILSDGDWLSDLKGYIRLSGMSSSKNLITGKNDTISCMYGSTFRVKRNLAVSDTCNADVVGALIRTFGPQGINPMVEDMEASDIEHYLYMSCHFSNGRDSTLCFDVTNDVKAQPRGGVITCKLTSNVKPPSDPGGGFDTEMADWDDNIFIIPIN